MGLLGRSNRNRPKVRNQSADRYLGENARNQASYNGDMQNNYRYYDRIPPGEYPLGYPPTYTGSFFRGYPGDQSIIGTYLGPPNKSEIPSEMPFQKEDLQKGIVVSKYPPWDPKWEKDHKKLLKKQQEEQQKLLKQQQKEAQRQLKIQQEQLKVQEAQMRRMQEDQMMHFQEQQRQLREEQDRQLQLLQQFAEIQQQQQQQQQMQMQASGPNTLEKPTTPIYDYSALGTLNLDYSTLGTLAYGNYETYPGIQQDAATSVAYANAYWSMLYQQNPYLLANYTMPTVQPVRAQNRRARPRYRKNRNSREVTLVTEDSRRYKSNPDSESGQSSDLFISGSDEEERENGDDLKNQILVQKNKLKKKEEVQREKKPKAASPRNQPVFMAELQKKIRDKQKKQGIKGPSSEQTPSEGVYGYPAAIFGYVPGAPPIAPSLPPVLVPYIAPGGPQPLLNTNGEEMETVKLINNMNINEEPRYNKEEGPVLPLAQGNQENEDIHSDGKSAIYAVPIKKPNVQPKPSVAEVITEDYEEQASGLIIDDILDDMENDIGVVDLNNKEMIRLNGQPDDMLSAVFTADHDGAETIYAAKEDALPITAGEAEGAEVGVHQEAHINFANEENPGRGAAELGVWREDHGTRRSPPPSYFAFAPGDNSNEQFDPDGTQANALSRNGRYKKAGKPQRKSKRIVARQKYANQNRYPVQPRRRKSKCAIQ